MANYTIGAVSLIPKSKNLDRVLSLETGKPLYFLVEIKDPRPASNALAFKIIQTAKEKFLAGTMLPAENFEEALRETNDILSKLTEEGQTEWLDNLSAVIALIYNDRLNLTSVGSSSCFLFRDQDVIEVTADQPKETRPLNTFSNILYGDLRDGDRLIVANRDFFENLSMDYLNQTLSKGTLKEAASYIARSLKKERVKTAGALILELKKESEAFAPVPDTLYIDQRQTKQFVKTFFRGILSRVKKLTKPEAAETIPGKIFPFLQKRKKWILIGFSIVLGLVLLFGIYNLVAEKQKAKDAQNKTHLLIQAEDKNRAANNLLLGGEKDKAKKLFQEAFNLISQIKTKDAETLLSKIISQLDKLNNITRVKPTEILDFSKSFGDVSVSQILLVDKTIYSADLKTNRIYQGKQSPASLPQFSGKFVSATYQSLLNILLFYQDQEGVYEYKIDENKLEKSKMLFDEKWEKAKILGSYFNYIYLLDQSEGQIYKHEKTTAGYSKGTAYVDKDKVDLKKAISMAVDGYIFVLNNDGTALKLMSGKPISDFKITGIPEPDNQVKNPVRIFTSSAISYLYILDGKRVLELDKLGNYSRMFVFDLPDLKDLWVNSKTKKIYVLSGNRVYEAGI